MVDKEKKPDLPTPPKEPGITSYYGDEEDTKDLDKALDDTSEQD